MKLVASSCVANVAPICGRGDHAHSSQSGLSNSTSTLMSTPSSSVESRRRDISWFRTPIRTSLSAACACEAKPMASAADKMPAVSVDAIFTGTPVIDWRKAERRCVFDFLCPKDNIGEQISMRKLCAMDHFFAVPTGTSLPNFAEKLPFCTTDLRKLYDTSRMCLSGEINKPTVRTTRIARLSDFQAALAGSCQVRVKTLCPIRDVLET